MLSEPYFPYILFLEGSNFLTHDITIQRPDGSDYILHYDNGTLNRLEYSFSYLWLSLQANAEDSALCILYIALAVAAIRYYSIATCLLIAPGFP